MTRTSPRPIPQGRPSTRAAPRPCERRLRHPARQDAPIFPRQAILLMRVSRNGTTMEARVFVPSNVETFNNEALDMAKNLRWNPAQKNGEPAEAWVQWPFQPVRQ